MKRSLALLAAGYILGLGTILLIGRHVSSQSLPQEPTQTSASIRPDAQVNREIFPMMNIEPFRPAPEQTANLFSQYSQSAFEARNTASTLTTISSLEEQTIADALGCISIGFWRNPIVSNAQPDLLPSPQEINNQIWIPFPMGDMTLIYDLPH